MPEPDLGQPKVFCQKGKCYPYDPARMKNPNINLEMKPGAGNLLKTFSAITRAFRNDIDSLRARSFSEKEQRPHQGH